MYQVCCYCSRKGGCRPVNDDVISDAISTRTLRSEVELSVHLNHESYNKQKSRNIGYKAWSIFMILPIEWIGLRYSLKLTVVHRSQTRLCRERFATFEWSIGVGRKEPRGYLQGNVRLFTTVFVRKSWVFLYIQETFVQWFCHRGGTNEASVFGAKIRNKLSIIRLFANWTSRV